ncbi:hypothetical protein [Histidinibacterium lentulum]|uniref:Uncharacterized protein n=1 Tax=Histidinibacterium lentulum TaxID=2480588 RepID=A0A3N2R6C7_9RHOB|nr:hypothetical protein [Histidinibacterium lentulum]ROU02953.1 hypothetical protein EAT49_06545 [Histidinibacterium lentulum]
MVRYVIETAPDRTELEVLCRVEHVVSVSRHGLRATASKRPIAMRLRGEVVVLRQPGIGSADRRAIEESFGALSG